MNNITIFKNITDTYTPYYIDLQTVYDRIKSEKYSDIITKIRSIPEKKLRDIVKKELPSICFSGKFKQRCNEGIIEHSGLVAVDFDHIEDYDSLWLELTNDEYTHMAFKSPSGDGIKIVVRIPANIETHRQSCRALQGYYKSEHLDQFEDEARVCYISSDPNIFWNKDSKVFTELKGEKLINKKTKEPILDIDDIYGKLKIWIEKNDSYLDGNKYKFLVRFATACNRFGVPQHTTCLKLARDYQNLASPVDIKDFEKLVKRVYETYVSAFATMCFERDVMIDKVTHEDTSKSILTTELPDNDIITCNDIRAEMREIFKTGLSKGETTHFPQLDEHWSWMRAEVTLLGGIGNHGKSAFMMHLCIIKSIKEGTKWAIFSPEQNPPTYFYNDIIQTYIGKPTEKSNYNRMSDAEYERGMDFANEYFYFVYPKNAEPTPEYINNTFTKLIVQKGVQGCIIDPFNQLHNDWGKHGRDDRYISDFLSSEKKFAIDHNVYKIIIGHPNSTITKGNDGNYNCPDVYDFAGGAMWNNKCDNVLQIHRPYYCTDPANTNILFKSQKIKKQKLVGIPGDVMFDYDREKGRYYVNGFNPLENEPQTSILEQDEPAF